MSDTPLPPANDSGTNASSIPDKTQLVQWHDEAAAAAADPDLHERIRDLTARALSERKLDFRELRDIIGAIASGVGTGVSGRGDEMRTELRRAIGGLDEALGSAAQKASYTLREAVDQGRAFREHELRQRLEELRSLESQFVGTLRETANQSGGKLREEMERLSAHLADSGTRTGEHVREALDKLATGLRSTAGMGRDQIGAVSESAADRLSQVASGVLAAMSDALKRQSERLRH